MFINFLIGKPACDCYPNNDAPIVPDIGILASLDPVAIDAASVDLVNAPMRSPARPSNAGARPGRTVARLSSGRGLERATRPCGEDGPGRGSTRS